MYGVFYWKNQHTFKVISEKTRRHPLEETKLGLICTNFGCVLSEQAQTSYVTSEDCIRLLR